MARTRLVKPGTFKNEDLGMCTHAARFLFVGLWTIADREGRIEYRPMRIKAELLPYDFVEPYLTPGGQAACRPLRVEALLDQLSYVEMITLYREETADRWQWIQINNFLKHQNPHRDEQESVLPPMNEPGMITSIDDIFLSENNSLADSHENDNACTALTLNPSTLNPSSIVRFPERKTRARKKKRLSPKTEERFSEFWEAWPTGHKVGKKECQKKWRSRGLDEKADIIIRDVKTRKQQDARWQDGFIPNPATYLNGDRWEDDYKKKVTGKPKPATSKSFEGEDYGEISGGEDGS